MSNARKEMEIDIGSETWTDTWDAHWRRIGAWSLELASARAVNRDASVATRHDPLLAVLDSPKRAEFLGDLGLAISGPESEQANPDRQLLV